ncbi:hypothetical protein [Rhizobium leguminosarum]
MTSQIKLHDIGIHLSLLVAGVIKKYQDRHGKDLGKTLVKDQVVARI